ncbi:hypothetical protein BJX64DRAFT_294901 [Aspergillus heterothallicus]
MQPKTNTSRQNTQTHQASQPLGRRGGDKAERRRQQVCQAQRAYRARSEAYARALEERVARLESALERTGRAVIEFTDILIDARILASHQHLAHHLRDTVKTCLDSARFGADGPEQVEYYKGRTPASMIADRGNREGGNKMPLSLPSDQGALSILPRSLGLSSGRSVDSMRLIEVPTFVDHLRITCLYQGFLMLNNPSVPLEALRRPFHLLLSLVTRGTITSFFRRCLFARLNNQEPHLCNEIPCFRVGGAGSHFSNSTAAIPGQTEASQQGTSPASSQSHDRTKADATNLPSSYLSLKEADEEWFDLLDLIGYLRAQDILLAMDRPTTPTSYRAVNVVNFTAALVERGICLGHSPGFKRSDVERAIESSKWM